MEQQVESVYVFQNRLYQGIENLPHQDLYQSRLLKMTTCGMQHCLPGYEYPVFNRPGYHLHVVISGKGRMMVNGTTYNVHAGQFFLLKENEEVHYKADEEDPWYYAWICLIGDSAKKYMEDAGFTDGVYVLDCKVDPMNFVAIVKEMIARPYLDNSSELWRLSLAARFMSYATESWEILTQTQRRRDDLTADDYVNYAVRYIRSNYSHIRIAEVADYIGISRSYFTEIFKRKIYMSPQEFLMKVRINRAKELLEQTQLPISVVAASVGYEDQLAFSRIFKKKIGESPEKYRKRLMINHREKENAMPEGEQAMEATDSQMDERP